ncbi:MAG: hypothetical protein EP349_00440 [Alphaproteobacteria bacterium]|nr:MAG: hypothetical protein EP349_00440 [Alphaproteobacteria bacterium]
MKLVAGLLIALLLLLPTTAGATSACMEQTPEQFAATKAASDMIVHGIIEDYGTRGVPGGWTEITVIKSYKGDAPEKLRIHGWASYEMPLYNYEKGMELLLLLKKDGDKYVMTDLTWKQCVPSVIYLPPEEMLQNTDGTGMTRAEFIDKALHRSAKTEE